MERKMSGQLRWAVFLTGIASVLGAALVPALSPLDPPLGIWCLNLVAGISLVVVGFVLSSRRPGDITGSLLGIAGIFLFAFALSWFRSPYLWTVSALGLGLYRTFAGHMVVAFPDGRARSRIDRAVVAVVYAWPVTANVVLLTLFDPRDYGWPVWAWSRNVLLLHGDRGLHDLIGRIADGGNLLLGLAVGVIFVRRWLRTRSVERRAFAPLAVAIGVGLGVYLLQAVAHAVAFGALESALSYAEPAAWILFPLGVLVSALRVQAGRAAVGDLVVDLRESANAQELRAAIARALHDPSLELALWNPGARLYVDAEGRPVELPQGDGSRTATLVEGADGPLGALVHDRLLAEEWRLVASVSAAVRLALENRRLADEVSLSRELPAGLAERLQREGRRVGETETLEVTVLVSDVRGYTSIAERADPHRLAGQLNEHRKEMTKLISDRGGTVMQFVGDEVFAVFGAPDAIDDHAGRAVSAALDMQAAQAAINDNWREQGLPLFGLGIGLSTGRVAGALLGSEHHTEYSVVGDTVNLASRLQQWAAAGEIVLSAETFAVAGRPAQAEALAPATVKGRAALVSAYKLRPQPATAPVS
jgi:class 3 adenylate cyclase